MAFMTASQLSQQYQSVLKPTNKPEHEISQVTSTEDRYEVKLSINQFEPEELTVKVVDRYIHIEGRHEEKNDKIGFFTRQFTRRYFLPEGVQPEAIRCTFSVDTNILNVSAPIISKKPVKELNIPIIVVGQELHKQKNKNNQKTEKEHKQKHDKHDKHHDKLDKLDKFEKLEKHLAMMHQQHQQQQQYKQEQQQQPLYSQPIKHHHTHPQQHHHKEKPLPQPPTASQTLPPPATASTSSSSRRHHHHHHYHHQDYPNSQMNF